MVVKITWLARRDQLTVYWFSDDDYVERALGHWVDKRSERLSCTDEEAGRWNATAVAYVDEVAAAGAELPRGRRRWWSRWRYEKAEAAYLSRIRAAGATYQPVRDVIEQRLAEAEAVRQAEARRAFDEQQQGIADAEARVEQWQRRQAVADQPLPNGLTPRSLAEQTDPPPLDLESASLVGDVAAWWAGVRAASVNWRARAAAVQSVVAAITTTAAALRNAGQPGISSIRPEKVEALDGWWIDLDWSGLPMEGLLREPDAPVAGMFLSGGQWRFDLYKTGGLALVPRPSGLYECAAVSSTVVGSGSYSFPRHIWRYHEAPEFADSLFPRWTRYVENGHLYRSIRVSAPDHMDPAAFVPYVEAVAERVVAAFTALEP